MPMPSGGFEQCYNAQAAVAAGSVLVLAADVVQAINDKQPVVPMLAKLDALSNELGEIEPLLADTEYFSKTNVQACVAAQIDPLIAMGRQPHYPPFAERLAPATLRNQSRPGAPDWLQDQKRNEINSERENA